MSVITSRSIDLAGGVVNTLNGSAQSRFVQTFTAIRAYRPSYDLTQHVAQPLQVTVCPKTLETYALSRGEIQELVAVDVAVQGWVDAASEVAECDAYMELVEQIKTALETPAAVTPLNSPYDCSWQGWLNDPLYEPDHLLKYSVFTSVSTGSFLMRRVR